MFSYDYNEGMLIRGWGLNGDILFLEFRLFGVGARVFGLLLGEFKLVRLLCLDYAASMV